MASLPRLILLALLLIPASTIYAIDTEEEAFLTEINDYRASYGLDPLSLSPTLTNASEGHSRDMANNDYFSHTGLDGRSPFDRMRDAGYDYPTSMGENIAAGFTTAQQVFEGWRNSPSHNETMLYPSFVVIGIGRHYNPSSTYNWYWTTDFGGYDDSGYQPSPPPKVQISSPTHPEQGKWYSCNDTTLVWSTDREAEGFSYLFDQNPLTNPDTTADCDCLQVSFNGVEDGTWYFHLRAKGEGGWGGARHFALHIDTTAPDPPPISSSSHPVQGEQYQNPDLELQWTPPQDESGIAGYSYLLDRNPTTVPDQVSEGLISEKNFPGLEEGPWYFHLRARDHATNWGAVSHFRIEIRTPPDANFSANPRDGPEPLRVDFTDLSYSSGEIAGRSWDFGDGEASDQTNPTHYYQSPGLYTVNLTVWEADGDVDSEVRTDFISVSDVQPNQTVVDQASRAWSPIIGLETTGVLASQDSCIAPSAPNEIHGHNQGLVIDSHGSKTYLEYELGPGQVSGNVLRATLALYLSNFMGTSSTTVSISYLLDAEWAEGNLSWENRPDTEIHELVSLTLDPSLSGQYVFFELPSRVEEALALDKITFVLSIESPDSRLEFSSRESCLRPVLAIGHSELPVHELEVRSLDDSGLFENHGQISIDGTPFSPPDSLKVVEGPYNVTYVPGYLFKEWLVEGDVEVSEENSRTTRITVEGNGSLTAHGELTNLTYRHDNGQMQYDFLGESGEAFAVSFSPVFKCSVNAVSVYLSHVLPSQEDAFLVYLEGQDGSNLSSPIRYDPDQTGWNRITFEEPIVVEGVFLVCLEFLNDNEPNIGIHEEFLNTSFTLEEEKWRPYPADFMVRSHVENQRPLLRITKISAYYQQERPEVGDEIQLVCKISPQMTAAVDVNSTSPSGHEFNTTLVSNSTGHFFLNFQPSVAGLWSFTFRFQGDENKAPELKTLDINISRGEVQIKVQCPFSSYFGEAIHIHASSTPFPVPLNLEINEKGGWKLISTMNPSPNGTCHWLVYPPHAGSYSFRVTWPGDQNLGQYSRIKNHTVFRADSEIILTAKEQTVAYGSSIKFGGTISPSTVARVILEKWHDSGWTTHAEVNSSLNGSYKFSWTPSSTGHVWFRSRWEGNQDLRGSSSEVVSIKISKAKSNLSCLAEPSHLELNETTCIIGHIEPPTQAEVLIDLIEPNEMSKSIMVMTNSSGFFHHNLTPERNGTWRIVASWKGDESYYGHSSPEILIHIGSLVGTALRVLLLLPFLILPISSQRETK